MTTTSPNESVTEPPAAWVEQVSRVSLLVNAQSGSGSQDAAMVAQAFKRWLQGFPRWQLHQLLVERDDFSKAIATVVADPPDLCVIAGGDGSVAGLTAAMVQADADFIIGIAPFGTMNLFCRDLHLPLDPEDALEAFEEAHVARVDYASVNGTPVLCSSMIGFAAKVSQQREHFRGKLTFLNCFRLVARIFQVLTREVPFYAEIRTEKETLNVKTRFIGVSHNDLAEAALAMPQRERLDTGKLHLYTFSGVSWWHYLRAALRFADGSWKTSPRILHREAQTITIRLRRLTRRVKLINDGEINVVDGPLHYEIQPQRLRFLRRQPDDAA